MSQEAEPSCKLQRTGSDSNNQPGASTALQSDGNDEMLETLTCPICCEIFYDCASAQPCMHRFCGGCLSSCLKANKECPMCRNPVKSVSKDHAMKNIVSAFLGLNPDHSRSQEVRDGLDAQNFIKAANITTSELRRLMGVNEEQSGDDDSLSSEGSDYEDNMPPPAIVGVPPGPMLFPPQIHHGNFGHSSRCRQSTPGPANRNTCAANATPDDFQCAQHNPKHVMCACCLQVMPDRRTGQRRTDVPIQCFVCSRFYCHAYWGCQKAGCAGCLATFKELKFSQDVLNRLIAGNSFESSILKQYLADKNLDLANFLSRCLEKLDSEDYKPFDINAADSNRPICYGCGLRNLQELAYQFRRDIPPADLPADVRNRDDCWWGRNCRTQQKSPQHARRLNHICEQTRFA